MYKIVAEKTNVFADKKSSPLFGAIRISEELLINVDAKKSLLYGRQGLLYLSQIECCLEMLVNLVVVSLSVVYVHFDGYVGHFFAIVLGSVINLNHTFRLAYTLNSFPAAVCLACKAIFGAALYKNVLFRVVAIDIVVNYTCFFFQINILIFIARTRRTDSCKKQHNNVKNKDSCFQKF